MQKAFQQTVNVFKVALPILIGVLLLLSLMHPFLQDNYRQWFSGHYLFDPLLGALAGSISFGMPLTSYVVGGELLEEGISLLAVTAFIMAWTTVGLAMLPLEATSLGWRFAIVRNMLNFIFSLLIAVATVFTMRWLP